MVTVAMNGLRRWTWALLAGLAVILILLLWLSPAERTLGQSIKLIYLHGALVRTAMVLFAVSIPVNLVALVGGRSGWSRWGQALAWAAVVVWLAHTVFSMVTTYATWGVFIAWFEPRTRFTFALSAAGIVIVAVARLLDSSRFSALVFVVLSGLALGLAPRLDAIQHPLNAIASSSSVGIRTFYAAILAVSLAMGGLVAAWLQRRFTRGR